MQELEVIGVRLQLPQQQPVVLLREVAGHRYLPVWIGSAEANAITLAQQAIEPPRPMTHDLLHNVLTHFKHPLHAVRITEMVDDVFHAELVFAHDVVIPSRTSDAVALALRAGCPILGAEEVLTQAGVPVPVEEENVVEKFVEFLEQVNPGDFSTPDEGK